MATEICNTNSESEFDAIVFFDNIDMRGAFMPLEELETIIDTAPDAARQHPDFQYLVGLLDGRMINEAWGGSGSENKIDERN